MASPGFVVLDSYTILETLFKQKNANLKMQN